MLFVLEPKYFFIPEQKEDDFYNLSMGQSRFSYELMFWSISIENGGKQKSKNALSVEINQLCDG